MNVDNKSLLLYAVTDRYWTTKEKTLISQVKDAIEGGITFLQLREKNLSYDEFLEEAKEIKKLTDKANIPFVINDNVEIAIKCNADGVHVGQSDMAAQDVRSLIGPDKILGVSAHTVEEAKLAEKNGADYLGVGAVFSTSTKKDATNLSVELLKKICDSVSIPVVAIGGITKDNLSELENSNINGVAVVSAIFAENNIVEATKKLKELSLSFSKK
ncbi:MAG: thiamine phosphate synthase [Clostridium sp.]|nr:thiamine phosphate synthase [Clostridium sp.]